MRDLIVYKTHFKSRFLQLDTSNDYDEDHPYPISIITNWYRQGLEIEFVFLKWGICIFVGYQNYFIIDYDENGITTAEIER